MASAAMSLVLALSLSGCDPREWFVCAIGACGVVLDEAAPRAPTGLTATPGDGRVVLGWRGNTEPDLFYYKAYRATAPGGPYTALPSTVLSAPLQTVRSIHSTSRRQSRTTATTKAANGITIAAEFGHLVGGPVDAGAVR